MMKRHRWLAVSTPYMIAVSVIVGTLSLHDAVAQGMVHEVNCNNGDTISQALAVATPGDTIRITGTCKETVTITTDRLTLEGQGSAVIDGENGDANVVTIEGVQGVTLTGFIVQNGVIGILGRRGADFAVSDTTLRNHARFGLQADDNTSVRITDCTARSNGRSGMRISENSNGTFRGTIISRDNGDDGIQVVNGSRGSFRPDILRVRDNMDAGLVVSFGSSAAIIGGELRAINNVDGVRLESAVSLLLFGINPVVLRDNTAQGLVVFEGSSLLLQNSTVRASENVTGVAVRSNANITLSGGFGGGEPTEIVLRDNAGDGLLVTASSQVDASDDPTQDAVTVRIRNNAGRGVAVDDGRLTLKDATIRNNTGGDVVLSFGARVSLSDVALGSLICDETVLSRGTTVCP